MKKNNYIVFAIAIILGIFLLWLWFYLGFNRVDNPLDLLLSILWWVIDAALVVGIINLERRRQKQIRTIYVAPTALYNSEIGMMQVEDAGKRATAMQSILDELKYNFHAEEMPEQDKFDYKYVVQTDKYDTGDSEERVWKGTVTKIDHVNGNVETEFDGVTELLKAMA